ncbi:hypothetical protein [Clostridium sp.]|uniref:hypothetical protein n=1 Tax=Clostridium sp. TaxID=1506 RepID=UPI003993EFD6
MKLRNKKELFPKHGIDILLIANKDRETSKPHEKALAVKEAQKIVNRLNYELFLIKNYIR